MAGSTAARKSTSAPLWLSRRSRSVAMLTPYASSRRSILSTSDERSFAGVESSPVNLRGGFDSERRWKDFMLAKTLVVAGAGPGLGLEIARRFGREGFNVALLARRL